MLPKSRILSALLVGLGLALIAAGFTAPRLFDVDARLPLNATATTWTLHDDSGTALTRGKDGTAPYTGPLTYQLHVDIQEPSDRDTATLRIGETTMRGDDPSTVDNLLAAQVWTYGIDRLTGAATGMAKVSHTIASPSSETPVDGYWLKFPSDAQKTNYPVFDPYLRSSSDAVFEEELTLHGRTVYRYHQDVPATNVATKFAGVFNTTQLPTGEEDKTDTAYLTHSATRDYFVDQVTGMLVGMKVSVKDYYADRGGKPLEDVLVFDAQTSEEDTAAFLEQAASLPAPALARAIFWAMIGVGALLALVGLAGVFGAFSRRRP